MSITPPSSAAAGTEFSDDLSQGFIADAEDLTPGIGPWKLAGKRLRRNKVALVFGALFLVIVVMCLLAPVYANDVAHTTPAFGNPTGQITVGGKKEYILSLTGIPIGPTWHSQYFLGADGNGRDVAVRLLYGGRNSLEIGFVATLITMIIAIILGHRLRLLPRSHGRDHLPDHGRPVGLSGRPARASPWASRSPSAGSTSACSRSRATRCSSPPSSSGSSTSRTWPNRCAARSSSCASASSSTPPASRACPTCGSCSPRSCPTCPRRSSCSSP